MQCFHNSLSVAHVTEKVRSPRDEILSSTLLYVKVPSLTIGTLRLRVNFHFQCSFLSVDLSQAVQEARIIDMSTSSISLVIFSILFMAASFCA
jgi:hypothetical protein